MDAPVPSPLLSVRCPRHMVRPSFTSLLSPAVPTTQDRTLPDDPLSASNQPCSHQPLPGPGGISHTGQPPFPHSLSPPHILSQQTRLVSPVWLSPILAFCRI